MIEFIDARIVELKNALHTTYNPPSKAKSAFLKGALASFEEMREFLKSRHIKNL